MSRAQRRAEERAERRAEKPTPMRQSLQRLEKPEPAAELTAREANELRGRNSELEYIAKLENEAREHLEHLIKVRMLVQSERQQFVRAVCRTHNLSDTDEFSIDVEAGVILRTGKMVAEPMQPVEVVAEPENGTAAEE